MSYKSYKYSLGTSNNAREYNWTTAGTVTLLKTRKITTERFAVQVRTDGLAEILQAKIAKKNTQ